MVAGQRVVGGVPRSAHFAEQLRHFPREDALVLKPANQLVLRLFPRGEQADPGGDVLREEFGELAVHGARFQCRARVAVGAAELRAQFTPMDGQFGPD